MKNKKLWIIIGVVIVIMINMQGTEDKKEGKKEAIICTSQSISGAYYDHDAWIDNPDDYAGQSFTAPVTGTVTNGRVYIDVIANNPTDYSASISTSENGASLTDGYTEQSTGPGDRAVRYFTFPNDGPSVTQGNTYYLTFKVTDTNPDSMQIAYDSGNDYAGGASYCTAPDSGDCNGINDADADMNFGLTFESCEDECNALESTAFDSITSWVTEPVEANKAAKRAEAVTAITEWITSC